MNQMMKYFQILLMDIFPNQDKIITQKTPYGNSGVQLLAQNNKTRKNQAFKSGHEETRLGFAPRSQSFA